MKRLLLFALGLLLCLPPLHGSGNDIKKLRIEICGGFAMVAPGDLNAQVAHDRMYENFFGRNKYEYYNSLFGSFYTYSENIEGELKKIKSALPLGIRVKYSLNPSITVSLGFKYLSKEQSSQLTHQYDVRILNPDGLRFYDEFSIESVNDPYSVSLKGYTPQVGIHYKIGEMKSVNLEIYFAAGPLFAEYGFVKQSHYREIDTYGFWSEQNLTYEIDGKGMGIALETGIQMSISVIDRVNFFFEGGFAYQKAGSSSGAGFSVEEISDLNADGYTEANEWEGPWKVIRGSYDRDWGSKNYHLPTNEFEGTGLPDFSLNLSGLQIRIGISFRL
jgi:hypothetical protein